MNFYSFVIALSKLFVVVVYCDIISKLHQTDYKIEYLRAEIVHFDKSIYKYANATTFKYNRTFAVTNMSFELKIDVDLRLEDVVYQAYKLSSNEYRTFPIRQRVNVCLLMKSNAFGMKNFRRTNSSSQCLNKKDTIYKVDFFHPDESQFPPLIPTGEYKLEITLLLEEKEVLLKNYYGIVYRPVKIPKG